MSAIWNANPPAKDMNLPFTRGPHSYGLGFSTIYNDSEQSYENSKFKQLASSPV